MPWVKRDKFQVIKHQFKLTCLSKYVLKVNYLTLKNII